MTCVRPLAALAALCLSASPAFAISESAVVTATGTASVATVAVTAAPGSVLVALISGGGPSTASSQTTSVSGCGLSWVLVKRANTRPGVADVWKTATSASLSACAVTGRLVSGSFFVRLTVEEIHGSSGQGSSASASGKNGAAKAMLMSLQAGSLAYGVGADWSVVQARTVLSGQRKLAESTPAGLGTFWSQALNGVTAAGSLTVGTSAPTSHNWNFSAVELVSSGVVPPPPCTFTVSPTTLTAPTGGTSSSVTVTASASTCAWTAASNAWLSVAPTSGTGSGSVSVTSAANSGAARSASVTVAGTSVTVNQDAAVSGPPTLVVTCPGAQSATSPDGQPVAVSYPAATTTGGVAPVTVTGDPASGSLFPVGTTMVTQTATSSDGQSPQSCTNGVTVTAASSGGTVTAASCSVSAVQAAIASAAVGDTVNIPAGTCTWSGFNVAKAVTLNGAGQSATTIVIGAGSGALAFTKQTNGPTRIKNITFSVTNNKSTPHAVTVSGPWPSGQPIIFQDLAIRLSGADFVTIQTPGGVIFSRIAFTGAWGDALLTGKDPQDAAHSWTTADTIGARDTTGVANIYVEDSTFTGGTVTDCDDGCRLVMRHNVLNDSNGFNSHGMDTSAVGMRHFEIYDNAFRFPDKSCPGGSISSLSNINQYIWIRGASGVIYNNVFDSLYSSCWGDKPEVRMDIRGVEDQRRNISGANITCSQVTYPAPHQLGQNHNGTTLFTDPITFWGNTSTDGPLGSALKITVTAGFNWGNPCGFDFGAFFHWGRDAVNTSVGTNACGGSGCAVDGVGGTPRAGYVASPYPHPLVQP